MTWRGRCFAAAAALTCLAAPPGAGAATITEFSAGISPGSGPSAITVGPDGNLWFTESLGNRIGRITPEGVVTEFSAGISPGSDPHDIVAGPDGNLWFTERHGHRIGRITPEGVVTEFSAGITPDSEPIEIVAGPDGNLWFTESTGRIGRITPAGVVTEFPARGYPAGITAGPDGNLWFAEWSGNRIGRITPEGVVTEFSAGISPGGRPWAITAGPDGNLWFTEYNGNRIGRITPEGVVTEFTPSFAPASQGITTGPDGNLWFTDDRHRLARVTTGGVFTDYSAGLTASSGPMGITTGPDGNLWFTEFDGSRIGRLTLEPPTATTGAATEVTDTAAALSGTVGARIATEVYFEHGPTTAYGSRTPVQTVSSDAEVVAPVTGLASGTTYHYRLVTTNTDGTSVGDDRSFTTTTPAPAPAPTAVPTVAPPGECANGLDDDRDTFVDRLDPQCAAGRGREAPRDNPLLACAGRRLVLTDVLPAGRGRVKLAGLTDPAFAGRTVSLHQDGREVARVVVRPDGSFGTTRVRAPRSRRARFHAALGSLITGRLKLDRKAVDAAGRLSAGQAVLSGRLTGPTRRATVQLLVRAGGCGDYVPVGRAVRLPRNGRFTIRALAPADVDIAVYRARIRTPRGITYTLPRVITLR